MVIGNNRYTWPHYPSSHAKHTTTLTRRVSRPPFGGTEVYQYHSLLRCNGCLLRVDQNHQFFCDESGKVKPWPSFCVGVCHLRVVRVVCVSCVSCVALTCKMTDAVFAAVHHRLGGGPARGDRDTRPVAASLRHRHHLRRRSRCARAAASTPASASAPTAAAAGADGVAAVAAPATPPATTANLPSS
jgi:hypothetical protein